MSEPMQPRPWAGELLQLLSDITYNGSPSVSKSIAVMAKDEAVCAKVSGLVEKIILDVVVDELKTGRPRGAVQSIAD